MTNLSNAHQPGYGFPSHPTAMAPKTHTGHRAGGALVRTHSRTSSGGGSRLGLGLQLTQKDPGPARYPDRPKKSHAHHEGNRSSIHLARNNSSVRLQSREPSNPSALRRAPTPSRAPAKPRVGFTISSPTEGEDDDAWVSSESGAATPSHESDTEEAAATPVDKRKPPLPPTVAVPNDFAKDEQPTPRLEAPPLPRVETVRPSQGSLAAPPPARLDYSLQAQPSKPAQTSRVSQLNPNVLGLQQQQPRSEPEPLPMIQSPPALPPVTKARSETHSPPRRSPDALKRQSMTRPPSTNSITSSSSHPLRPHPLIRAHSIGHGVLRPAKPAPLAPLTTVLTEPGEISATSPTSLRATSPTLSMQTNGVSPVLSQPSSSESEASRQLRRTSVSSRSSVATLPANMYPSATIAQLGRAANHDRQRTLSSSSTFGGALSNLSNLNLQIRSTPSPPKTPVQHVVAYFPPNEQVAQSESVHALLPPPYLSAHLTMLAYRNPLAESYDRVLRAKQGR